MAPLPRIGFHASHGPWRTNVLGGEVNWELLEFDTATRFVRPEDMRRSVLTSADPGRHAARLAAVVELGVEEIQLHQLGRNRQAFIDTFGAGVLPALRR